MSNPQISIIVPVYNVEPYLRRCLDSILAQTFTNWECILVDDGSTDGSGKICDEYAEGDERFHIVHQENKGVAMARSIGVKEASGEYSIHADGDDWMEPSALRNLYIIAKNELADVVIGDFVTENKNGVIRNYVQEVEGMCSKEILKRIIREELFGALWHKFIKHSLYKEMSVKFFPDINYCEDILVCAQLMKNNIRVVHLHKVVYNYSLINSNSITRNYTPITFENRKKFVCKLEDILGAEYEKDIELMKLKIKIEALRNKCLTLKDFNKYIPTSISAICKLHTNKRLKFKLLYYYFIS